MGGSLSAPGMPPAPQPWAQYLREVAVGPRAAAEAPLVPQAVVGGRLHHVARVDLAGADVVLIRQAAEQVVGVTRELGAGQERGGRGGQARAAHLHRAVGACPPHWTQVQPDTDRGQERSLAEAEALTRSAGCWAGARKLPLGTSLGLSGSSSLESRQLTACVRGFRSPI